jgi:hypothetical protein
MKRGGVMGVEVTLLWIEQAEDEPRGDLISVLPEHMRLSRPDRPEEEPERLPPAPFRRVKAAPKLEEHYGGPMALETLMPEAMEEGGRDRAVRIPAVKMRARFAMACATAERKQFEVVAEYEAWVRRNPEQRFQMRQIEGIIRRLKEERTQEGVELSVPAQREAMDRFIAAAEAVEARTGRPCWVYADT